MLTPIERFNNLEDLSLRQLEELQSECEKEIKELKQIQRRIAFLREEKSALTFLEKELKGLSTRDKEIISQMLAADSIESSSKLGIPGT